jgi:hypothetical protein
MVADAGKSGGLLADAELSGVSLGQRETAGHCEN